MLTLTPMLALILLMMVFLSSTAVAQEATGGVTISLPAESDTEPVAFEPYIAKVTGNSVYVRSNPGKPYHPVCKLSKGHQVVVRDVREGTTNWVKVEPTAGCFCYISKKFVKLQNAADAAIESPKTTSKNNMLGQKVLTGLMTGNNVRVRSGSIRVKPQFAEHLSHLSKPATVKIIGESGDFYKIIPPSDVYFWIAQDYLKKVGPVTDVKLTQLRATATKNALGMADPAKTTGLSKKYIQLAQKFEIEQTKALIQRNLDPFPAQVAALLKEAKSSSLKAAIEGLQKAIIRAHLAKAALMKSLEDDKILIEKLKVINQKALARLNDGSTSQADKITSVNGRLARSAVFTASNQNRRFLVLDNSGTIQCYALSDIPAINLDLYVGKTVKLLGEVRFDAFSKINLFFVTSVVDKTPAAKKDEAKKDSDVKKDDKTKKDSRVKKDTKK